MVKNKNCDKNTRIKILHLCNNRKTGMNGPSRCLKNNGSPDDPHRISTCSWLKINKI